MTTKTADKSYYVVKIQAQPSGKWGYVKHTLDVNSFLNGSLVWTDDRKEAERFGQGFGEQVAKARGGKLVKVNVTAKKKSSATTAAVIPPPVKKKIYVGFVLDKSGSMGNIRLETVNAINRLIQETKDASSQSGIETFVSLWTFNNRRHTDRFQHKIEDVSPLAYSDYYPDGGTALFAAVGDSSIDLESAPRDDQTSILLHVITDGDENASGPPWVVGWENKASKLIEQMVKLQATDRWTIAFQLPPGKKTWFCRTFGVPDGNVREWEATKKGVEETVTVTGASTRGYYAAAAAAPAAFRSRGFFTTDLSKVTKTDLVTKLKDIHNMVKPLVVEKEQDIQSFIQEKTGQTYRKGDAFYALTKTEKVQGWKKILVKVKGESQIYTGTNVREVLGLPAIGDYKVQPGNHANFDLFVQSASGNRKLVRGTTVIYVQNGQSI